MRNSQLLIFMFFSLQELTTVEGVECVQLYKKEFTWKSGSDLVVRGRMKKGSPVVRFSTSCCHTPIGFSMDSMESFPFVIVYRNLLTFVNGKTFLPRGWRLNTENVPKDKRHWQDVSSTVVCETVPLSFFARLMSRMAYGLLMRMQKPDPLACVNPNVTLFTEKEDEK